MIIWQATIKERGNDHILTPSFCVPRDGMHDYINEEYLIEFWGLNRPDVEWYKLERLIWRQQVTAAPNT